MQMAVFALNVGEPVESVQESKRLSAQRATSERLSTPQESACAVQASTWLRTPPSVKLAIQAVELARAQELRAVPRAFRLPFCQEPGPAFALSATMRVEMARVRNAIRSAGLARTPPPVLPVPLEQSSQTHLAPAAQEPCPVLTVLPPATLLAKPVSTPLPLSAKAAILKLCQPLVSLLRVSAKAATSLVPLLTTARPVPTPVRLVAALLPMTVFPV